jgi:hypothetical protein
MTLWADDRNRIRVTSLEGAGYRSAEWRKGRSGDVSLQTKTVGEYFYFRIKRKIGDAGNAR